MSKFLVASIAEILAISAFTAAPLRPAFAQTATGQSVSKPSPVGEQETSSGPLAWVTSDNNPKTVFWTYGRFVPVDNPKAAGDAEVATILCSARENLCLEMDSTSAVPNLEQIWIEEFKPVGWDKEGISAEGRSLDGCTDETLKIRFKPLSVLIINSPVLPMSEHCKQYNNSMDKLAGKNGETLKGQMEQDLLVPTRGLIPFQDSAPPRKNR